MLIGAKHEWSYEGECGPQTWQKSFLGARGKHQSPINIETTMAKFDPELTQRPLVVDYDHHSCSQIKNTGYTFQVDSYQKNLSSSYTICLLQRWYIYIFCRITLFFLCWPKINFNEYIIFFLHLFSHFFKFKIIS